MAEQSTSSGASQGAGAGAAQAEGKAGATAGEQRGVTIHTQYIKDLSVENPNAPQIFVNMKQAPNVNVSLDVNASRLQENAFEVVLAAEVKASVGEQTGFVIELKYACLVSIDASITGDAREAALLIETPRHLFPFARSVIASATRDAGYPPLLINPVDFTRLYREQKARIQSQQQGQQGQQPSSSQAAGQQDAPQGTGDASASTDGSTDPKPAGS